MLKKTDNPWLGLASYEYKDAYRFFGRERELDELKTAICNNPFTTIYGISGAGKTSLINAGMIPLLEQECYLPVRIRLEHQTKVGYNSQIIAAIQNAIDEKGGEMETLAELSLDDVDEEEKLWAFLFASKIWSSTNHRLVPVIFIDQFEEIFTKNETDEIVSSFFESINALQYNTPPKHISELLEYGDKYVDFNDIAQFRMVFIMREDFLARLEDHSFDIPALRKNRRGIKRMDGHQALEVILFPYPSIVSREVALQILGKVVGKEVRDSETALSRLSVDTSMLSLFCSELYQKAVKTNEDVITKDLVGQFGDDIITSFYEDTMKLVSNETMEYLEAHLLTYSGFRNTMALEDLIQNGIKPEELKRLSEKRLIRIETLDGTERVEFMHDVLCKVAKEQRDTRTHEAMLKKEERMIRRINAKFLITSTLCLIGMIFLCLFSSYHASAFHYIPSIIVFSLSICGIHGALFSNKLSKYLIVRYAVAGIIVLFIAPVIFLIRKYVFYDTMVPNYMSKKVLAVLLSPFYIGIFISFFLESFSKRRILINVFKTISLLSLTVLFLFLEHFSLALMMFLFAWIVLIPYCYTKEKNVWWISSLVGLIVILSILIVFYYEEAVVIPVLIILLLSAVMLALSLLRYKRERSYREAWNYCIAFTSYIEHPFFLKTLSVLFLILVVLCSAGIGMRLYDHYTILGIVFLAPVSCTLLKCLYYGPIKLFYRKNTPANILLLLLLAAIIATQYVYGRLIWLMIAWALSAVLLYVIGPIGGKKLQGNFGDDKLPGLVIWFVAFFCIPVLCMGYNVFSLPKYARVYNSTIAFGNGEGMFQIRNRRGLIGLRDRCHLVIPTEYKTIKPSSNNDYQYRYNRDYNQYYPNILFNVTQIDNSYGSWDCSMHLDMNNICTKRLLELYHGSPYSLNDELLFKYLKYLNLNGENILVQSVVKRRFEEGYYNYYSRFQSGDFLNNIDERYEKKYKYSAVFAKWLDGNAWCFSFLASDSLYRAVVDTLYAKCEYYDSVVTYSDLVKYRIYAGDYEKALLDAQESKSRNESYADCRLIEALYFNKQYEAALSLLENNKNNIINVDEYEKDNRNLMKYKYLGDVVWQDMVEYKRLGILQDTVSQYYLRLENILKFEKTHPYYDYIRWFSNVVRPSMIWETNKDYELCICKGESGYYHSEYNNYSFIMCEKNVLSPVMKSFALSDDEKIMLIVDKADNKRKYVDMSGDSLRLMPGCYDHAWRYSEGLAVVSVGNKIGVINKKGVFVIEPVFPMPDYYYYGFSKWIVDGQYVKYDDIYGRENPDFIDFVFQNGLCPMSSENGRYGLIDKQGNWVVESAYDYIGKPDEFGDRVVVNYEHKCSDRSKKYCNINKIGIINKDGNLISPIE